MCVCCGCCVCVVCVYGYVCVEGEQEFLEVYPDAYMSVMLF